MVTNTHGNEMPALDKFMQSKVNFKWRHVEVCSMRVHVLPHYNVNEHCFSCPILFHMNYHVRICITVELLLWWTLLHCLIAATSRRVLLQYFTNVVSTPAEYKHSTQYTIKQGKSQALFTLDKSIILIKDWNHKLFLLAVK